MHTNLLIKRHKHHLLIAGGFLFFLLTIPYFNQLSMKCLRHIPGQSYTYSECTIRGALDQYIILALVGLGLSLILIYLNTRRFGIKTFIISALILTTVTIYAYYLYLPIAQARVAASSVFLDTLLPK